MSIETQVKNIIVREKNSTLNNEDRLRMQEEIYIGRTKITIVFQYNRRANMEAIK